MLTIAGRFNVINSLSRDNKVLLVTDQRGNRQVVLKQLAFGSEEEKRQARIEKDILAGIDHPNIIKFICDLEFDLGLGPKLALITDYCYGGSLSNVLKLKVEKVILFNPNRKILLAAQLISSVCFIHEEGIIHRDIKSSNIFLSSCQYKLKLGDFGLSRQSDESEIDPTFAAGTLQYASPEVLDGRPLSTKSDVWALGCVLFEISEQKHPFVDQSQYQRMTKIMSAERDQSSGHLAPLVDMCLIVSVDERADSIRDLRQHQIIKSIIDQLESEMHPLEVNCGLSDAQSMKYIIKWLSWERESLRGSAQDERMKDEIENQRVKEMVGHFQQETDIREEHTQEEVSKLLEEVRRLSITRFNFKVHWIDKWTASGGGFQLIFQQQDLQEENQTICEWKLWISQENTPLKYKVRATDMVSIDVTRFCGTINYRIGDIYAKSGEIRSQNNLNFGLVTWQHPGGSGNCRFDITLV